MIRPTINSKYLPKAVQGHHMPKLKHISTLHYACPMFTSHKANIFVNFMTFIQLERRDQNKNMQPYLNVECPSHSSML